MKLIRVFMAHNVFRAIIMKRILLALAVALSLATLFSAIAGRAIFVAYAQVTAASTSTANIGVRRAPCRPSSTPITRRWPPSIHQIAQYQAELQQVGANKKTLQAAINGA